jgi:hypothetical protein
MIRIAADDLKFARDIAQVRRKSEPWHGSKSWPGYHHLDFDGNTELTFRTTDTRIGLICKFPITGEDDPWDCRVATRNFDLFADSLAMGGSLALNCLSPRVVRVEKGKVETGINDPDPKEPPQRYPFFRLLIDTPFPFPVNRQPGPQLEVISLAELSAVLSGLIPASCNDERKPSASVCTFHPDRRAITRSSRVLLDVICPPVLESIHLTCPDARRLGRWLKLLKQRGETSISLSHHTGELGHKTYLFATLDGRYEFHVFAANRSVPKQPFAAIEAESPLIKGTIALRDLRAAAGLFVQFAHCRLKLEIKSAQDKWALVVTPEIEIPGVGGPLEIEVQAGGGATQIPSFWISPRDLMTSVDRHSSKQVHFSVRREAQLLSLSDIFSARKGTRNKSIVNSHIRLRWQCTRQA